VRQKVVRSVTTDRAGEAILTFTIPDSKVVLAGAANLTLLGTLRGSHGELATSRLETEIAAPSNGYIRILEDKQLYQPGQTVHIRALAFGGLGKPVPNAPLTLTVKDPGEKKILEKTLTTDRFGIAAYDWKLNSTIDTGNYNLSIEYANKKVADSSYGADLGQSIKIERYDLPEFTVSAELDRGYYLDGQTPEVKIHARFLFGKAVAGGQVRLVREEEKTWNPKTREMEEHEDSGQRVATFHLDLGEEFEKFRDASYFRYRDLTFHAYVTDSATGKTEPRKFSLRVSREPIHIYLEEIGGDDQQGEFLVNTVYADGTPAACQVTIDAMRKETAPARMAAVNTSRYGLAKVRLAYPAGVHTAERLKLRIQARDAKGLKGQFDDQLYSNSTAETIWIEPGKYLLKPNEAIQAVIHGPRGKLVDLDVIGTDGTLAHQRLTLTGGRADVTVPADARFHGEVILAAYAMRDFAQNRYESQPQSATVLYPEDKELRLQIAGLPKTSLPGGEIRGSFRVTDAFGAGIPAAIGIAVTDQAVAERARTEEDFEERSWGWYGWYREHWERAGFTLDDLNKLDMSKPLPDGIDLVAESLLHSPAPIAIESNNESDTRDQFESLMESQLEPLGKVLENAGLVRLTGDQDAIKSAARNAKLDESVLLDPWGTPYRPEVNIAGGEDILTFISAGPDKKFGTNDDFSLQAAHQSVFAHPGQLLAAMLKQVADAGQPLPGTPDLLLVFAKARGLDLPSLRDPDGHPFVYSVRLDRRWLSISVAMKEKETEIGFVLPYRPSIWTSPLFDYFHPLEGKLYAAINTWMVTGHSFPDKDSEIRAALSNSALDPDILRDPAGQPYKFRGREIAAYTRTQKVTGGEALNADTRPVIQHMHAVQVLRTPRQDEVLPSGEEIVGQVVRPFDEQSGKNLRPEPVAGMNFRGNTGAIGGTVTDPSGAVIPGATVVVSDEATGKEITFTTTDTGTYLVANLEPDSYSIRVSANGFMNYKVTNVEVNSASLSTVDVELNIGAVAETVQVSADRIASLETASASVSSMAANDRDPTAVRTFRTPSGKATLEKQDFTPRLRHVFEETAYWQPSLATDDSGRAAFNFHLPDSLTTWNLSAMASTLDGRMQSVERTFASFQPLFVDLDLPQILTAGDDLTLPVALRNYSAHAVTLPVALASAPWMTPLTPQSVRVSVPAGGAATAFFGFRATGTTEQGAFRVTAANRKEGDAVEKEIRVHPDGEPRQISAMALLREQTDTLDLDLPTSTIPGSLYAQLRVTPNLGSRILHSMDALVRKPHGCAEQTISSTYPALLLLQLLETTGGKSARSGVAKQYLQQGYDRLIDYIDASGGITYWGGGDHHPDAMLTAYGIEFLQESLPFISVQRSHVAAARRWLIDNQRAEGGWSAYAGSSSARDALYIAVVLAKSLPPDAAPQEQESTRKAIERAATWANSSASLVHDPFANALRLQLAVLRKDPPEQQKLAAELIATAKNDSRGVYWDSEGSLPFYIWGQASSVESTALALRSLNRTSLTDTQRDIVDRAVLYLLGRVDFDGVWYTGQTTIQVLKALLPFAVAQTNHSRPAQSMRISVNGVPLPQEIHFDAQILDAPKSVDIGAQLRPGKNTVTIESGNAAPFASAEIAAGFYVPWHVQSDNATTTGKEYGLDFSYHCNDSNATAGTPIDCEVQERRFGSAGFGMLLAEAGLPPGAEVDRESLAKLLSEGTVSRYEIQPDRIVFYTWSWKPGGLRFHFRFTPRYAVHAKAAPALLFDYYNPDERVSLPPQTFIVNASGKE
jgi:hypothetical protein